MLKLFGDHYVQWFNERTFDQQRPIDIAARYGHLDIIEKFLENKSVVKELELDIRALAHAATRHEDKRVVDFLKNRFSSLDDILHAACRQLHGHNSISSLTVTNAGLAKLDEDGLTPLMVAVKHRRFECVKALLDTGQCTENVLSACGTSLKHTVLHICAEIQHNEITDALLGTLWNLDKKRGPLVQQDAMGNTPLHICAQKGNEYMCEQLLVLYRTFRRSIPGNTPIWHLKNYNKLTAFQEAVDNNQLKVVKKMLDSVPESDSRIKMIQATDDQLRTCLHIAALKGKLAIYNATIKEYITIKYRHFITIFFWKIDIYSYGIEE